jgi:hypothetical protein
MPPSRRYHEQRLANRVPALVRTVKQQGANFVGAFGTTGLARRNCLFAGTGQRCHQQLLLRRLARALPTFERDEFTARQFLFPKRR